MRSRLIRLGVLLTALSSAVLVLAGPASAHATVVASDPLQGARLQTVPSVVSITFDQPVTLGAAGYLHTTDQTGRRVDAGPAYHPNNEGSKIADNLKSGLGDGTYTESFRIISADSHPVAGTIQFVVGNGVLSTSVVNPSTVNRATSVVFDIARWVSFGGFALLVSSWLALSVWPAGRDDRRNRAITWTGLAVTTAGAVAELLLQGPYAAGTGLGDIANWPLLDGTLHTPYGQYHSARLVLLGLTAAFLGWALQGVQRRSRLEPGAALLLGGGIAYTFSKIGHASTTSPSWLSIPADMLHIGGMATWLGGLVVLVVAVLPRREPDELRTVLPVFSRVAFVSIVVLAVTGGYAAWRGVGTIHAIFSTTYGLLVSLKVILFVGIVLLGNFARKSVRHRDPAAGAERIRRSVLVEVVIAVGVLVATAVLVAEPRGKEALAVAEARPRSASTSLGGGRLITVTLDPGKHGTVGATVALSDGAQPQQVTATATLPAKQLGPIPLGLASAGHDVYSASGLNLPLSGKWVIDLVVTMSQFDATTTSVTIHLY